MEMNPEQDDRPWEVPNLDWPERAKIRKLWEQERGLEVKVYDGWGGDGTSKDHRVQVPEVKIYELDK